MSNAMNGNRQPDMSSEMALRSGRLVRRVWFTMVLIPGKGWTRVGKAYGSRENAKGWLPFVSGAWHGLRTKVSQCTLRWVDGAMTERSRETLSTKYNMEPPAPPNDKISNAPTSGKENYE